MADATQQEPKAAEMTDAPQQEAPAVWQRVCRLDEIPPRGARTVEIGGRSIAVFRASDDGVFALLDRCPHRGGPLSQGIVHGHCVTCPLHDWVIELATGEARTPDEGRTERFEVRIDGADVVLGIPAGMAPQTSAAGASRSTPDASAGGAAPAVQVSEGVRLAAAR